jgi:hypothetical protein
MFYNRKAVYRKANNTPGIGSHKGPRPARPGFVDERIRDTEISYKCRNRSCGSCTKLGYPHDCHQSIALLNAGRGQ